MADARVPLALALDAFGLPITVTRSVPGASPVATTGAWLAPLLDEALPAGTDLQRREPRRVMAVSRTSELASLPRNSLVSAPEELGGPAVLWRVDSLYRAEYDHWRVVLVAAG